MSKIKVEVDCTRRCKSRSHGQALTSAITKRSISDEAIASFIKATCANFLKAFDFEGRTALHMAASRGRSHLMEWLVRHSSEAFANARDRESGYTPLHRSIFYGHISAAVALMKMGVNTDIVDKDDYKALEHAMLDRQYMYKHEGSQPSEVYVWGTNSNYTLGTGTQQHRNTPELLGSFTRNNTCVKQVCIGKFHSVWVCSGATDGEVWCCGQIARAGAPHSTALQPVPLRLSEPCVQAAVMLNSTVFLLESGTVIQYSLNSADNISQSSAKTPSCIKLPYVKPLLKLSQPIGICAGRSHAVVWNVRAIYTWGVNVGQLGHPQEDKLITAPKRVAVSMNIKEEVGLRLASASDAATVFTTSRGDVYLLHKYICKKIAIKQINLRQVCVEAKVSEQGAYSRVTVLLLTDVGQLLIWQDTTNQLTRCVFGLSHQIVITQVTLTHDALYFTTKYGEAFIGTISRKTTPTQPQPIKKEKERDNNKSALVKFLEKDDCTSVRIAKIPNVHRAVGIAVDSEGLNFACLQIKPTCGLTSLPELSPSSLSKHMESLLESATEDDLLHDVIFKVGTKLYPAHIFIVASSSERLYNLYQDQLKMTGTKPTVTLDNVHPEVFDRILRFMYTGTCDVVEVGPCGLKIRKEDLIAAGKKEKEEDDVDLDLIENSSEISAFEAYKQADKQKRGARNKRVTETPPRPAYCDPVKMVQAAAKRLQVMALHKLLDKFYYRDGTVYVKGSASFTKNPPQAWDRNSFPELVNTNVCSKDGMQISAHKCILAARLEYFNGMFMHSWTESKLLSTVTLPINHGILLPVINFLYTDSCPEVEKSDSLDFICSMLIVADQLFITRLREMCEVALSNLITLKNCAELCQFAHTYNATQLKQCAMEFISLNLSSILENKTLDVIEDVLLDDISKYYCKFNPIMSSRVITPFFYAPTDEVIEEFAINFPINLAHTDEELKKDESIVEITKKKNKSKKIEYTENEKARMRYESVSSITSLDLSNDVSGDITLSLSNISKESEKGARDKQEKWIEVPTAQNKQTKVIQARLKAASTARDIMNEPQAEQFTKLTKNNSFSAIARSSNQENNVPTTSRMSVSPKDSPIAEMARSPQGNIFISHIGPKLSQKQRKKMAMMGEQPTGQKLDGYLANKLIIESPPEKPKNPWKICEPPVATSSPNKAKTIEFNQILTDQKKQKEDFSRIMTKPLMLTQDGTPIEQSAYPGSEHLLREAFRSRGLPESSLDIMLASISPGTMKQYNSTYKSWWQFCNIHSLESVMSSIPFVIKFLTEKFESGAGYNTLSCHKSALSLLMGEKVGTDDRIKRFMKGVFRLKPAMPRYNEIWDPIIVLNHLAQLPNNSTLSLEMLSKKLATLLALATAQRVQTLSLIRLENISTSKAKITIVISDLIKTSVNTKKGTILDLPFYPQEPKICPARTLQDYIQNTSAIRNKESYLFITFKKPYHRASKQTISRWVKATLAESGIDTSQFTTHSTRHSATSSASKAGVSLDVIRKTAGWSEGSLTFARFYNLPTQEANSSNDFIESVFNLNRD